MKTITEKEFKAMEKDNPPIMKCGHAANSVLEKKNGVVFDPPKPFCAIHDEMELADVPPELEGRTARCGYCRKAVPSHKGLAFFEYRGAGSADETLCAHCGCYPVAHKVPCFRCEAMHDPERVVNGHLCTCFCHDNNAKDGNCRMTKDAKVAYHYEARGPNEFDSYYCGCRGWD
jgi:hypothetical protein